MNQTNLLCPHCNAGLLPVTIKGKYGQSVIVDQCTNCGGLWFDEWELFSPESTEIKKLDNIDENKLASQNTAAVGSGNCPKCKIKLEILKDPLIPKEIEMNKCSQCDGFWMNKGEASEYKEYQVRKKSDSKTEGDKEYQNSVKKFLDLHREKNDTLRLVGTTLSSPLNPMDWGGESLSPEDQKARNIASVAMMVLEVLFRVFLGR